MTDFARCNSLACAAELPENWQPAGVVAYSGAIYSKTGPLKREKQPAPTLLFHGQVDKIVPYKQITLYPRGLYGANAIVKKLDKYEYPFQVYRFPGLGHEVSVCGPLTVEELNLFVQQYIRAGRRTEVDTISGSVVSAAKKVGVSVPTHEFVVNTIHALEGRPKE